MKKGEELVVCAVVLFAALSVSGSESSMEWAKRKLDSLVDSAEHVASSVKQTASSMFVEDDKEGDGGYCTDYSCYKQSDVADIETTSDSYLQSWNVFSTIQEYLTRVKNTITYNIHKKAEEMYQKIEDFADRVRDVFREEFGSFLEVLWERAVGTNPADDTLYGRFKNAVEQKVMLVGLIIICLIISYIIWLVSISICSALVWIILFNSSVLLTYKLLGAKWVYWIFWQGVGYTWYTLSFIWTYPYISAGVIIAVSVGTVVWSCCERCDRVKRREEQEDMMRNINKRLRDMEKNQDKLLRQQNEILRLLRTR